MKKIYIVLDQSENFVMEIKKGENTFSYMGQDYSLSVKEDEQSVFIKMDFMDEVFTDLLRNKNQ